MAGRNDETDVEDQSSTSSLETVAREECGDAGLDELFYDSFDALLEVLQETDTRNSNSIPMTPDRRGVGKIEARMRSLVELDGSA